MFQPSRNWEVIDLLDLSIDILLIIPTYSRKLTRQKKCHSSEPSYTMTLLLCVLFSLAAVTEVVE